MKRLSKDIPTKKLTKEEKKGLEYRLQQMMLYLIRNETAEDKNFFNEISSMMQYLNEKLDKHPALISYFKQSIQSKLAKTLGGLLSFVMFDDNTDYTNLQKDEYVRNFILSTPTLRNELKHMEMVTPDYYGYKKQKCPFLEGKTSNAITLKYNRIIDKFDDAGILEYLNIDKSKMTHSEICTKIIHFLYKYNDAIKNSIPEIPAEILEDLRKYNIDVTLFKTYPKYIK